MKPSHFMNRVLLFVLLLVVGKGALSQERIDTLYYSRSGMTVRNPVFADYYRLALYPADAAGLKMFKDFYISGELRREGRFQTIDTLDDRRTVFDGDVVSYFKNGRMSEKSYYSEGLLEGEYRQYDENGTLKTRASYAGGELSGCTRHTTETAPAEWWNIVQGCRFMIIICWRTAAGTRLNSALRTTCRYGNLRS